MAQIFRELQVIIYNENLTQMDLFILKRRKLQWDLTLPTNV